MASSDCDNSKVNLLDLSASCLSSAIVAADQITALAGTTPSSGGAIGENDVKENKKNARLKIDGSFVTDADMAAQQIIVDALHKVSSGIRIVGEENDEEMRSRVITGHEKRLAIIFQLARQELIMRHDRENQQESIRDYEDGNSFDLPLAQRQNFDDESKVFDDQEQSDETKKFEVDTDRISVFIDPLDATNSYAKGDHEPVSILVSIVMDKAPCFGVICKPFGYPGQTSVLNTGCMAVYGGTFLGGVYIAGGRAIAHLAEDLSDDIDQNRRKLPRAVISKSRSQGIVQNFVTQLGERGIIHPEPLLVSGAGEKSLRIITGFQNEGLWFYPKGGTSLWDVAASDALLRAMGGRLTDKFGNDMDYSKSRKEAENRDGVVACYDKQLHADCIRIFLEGSWEDN